MNHPAGHGQSARHGNDHSVHHARSLSRDGMDAKGTRTSATVTAGSLRRENAMQKKRWNTYLKSASAARLAHIYTVSRGKQWCVDERPDSWRLSSAAPAKSPRRRWHAPLNLPT